MISTLRLMTLSTLLYLSGGLTAIAGELVIIAHPSIQHPLDADFVSQLYLGKQRSYQNGIDFIPLQLPEDDPLRRQFTEQVLNKSPSQLRAYWAKRIFTGKGKPPSSAVNRNQAIKLVLEDRQFLSYADIDTIDAKQFRVIRLK